MEDYAKFDIAGKHEYVFADSYTDDDGLLRLVCPNTGGGNLGGWRGCRTDGGLLAKPDFEPKAILFHVGSVGSYGRQFYWLHRFETEENGFYVRDVTPGGKPREYSRKVKNTNIYNTIIFLYEIQIAGLKTWEPPSLL